MDRPDDDGYHTLMPKVLRFQSASSDLRLPAARQASAEERRRRFEQLERRSPLKAALVDRLVIELLEDPPSVSPTVRGRR